MDFNGLGSPGYCITVRRTEAIQALLAADILGQVQALLGESFKLELVNDLPFPSYWQYGQWTVDITVHEGNN